MKNWIVYLVSAVMLLICGFIFVTVQDLTIRLTVSAFVIIQGVLVGLYLAGRPKSCHYHLIQVDDKLELITLFDLTFNFKGLEDVLNTTSELHYEGTMQTLNRKRKEIKQLEDYIKALPRTKIY